MTLLIANVLTGQIEPKSNGTTNMGHRSRRDLLTRERAALGDEANLFRLNTDNAATVQNDHDDLLAGGWCHSILGRHSKSPSAR